MKFTYLNNEEKESKAMGFRLFMNVESISPAQKIFVMRQRLDLLIAYLDFDDDTEFRRIDVCQHTEYDTYLVTVAFESPSIGADLSQFILVPGVRGLLLNNAERGILDVINTLKHENMLNTKMLDIVKLVATAVENQK